MVTIERGDVQVKFTCPFCGKKAFALRDALIHEIPYCAQFERLEPDEFLHQVNEYLRRLN